jgi:hypothetical protein
MQVNDLEEEAEFGCMSRKKHESLQENVAKNRRAGREQCK